MIERFLNKLEEVWYENKDDFLYLLFAGVPSGVLSFLINPYIDYSHIY